LGEESARLGLEAEKRCAEAAAAGELLTFLRKPENAAMLKNAGLVPIPY
jgi:hypothetical protein